MFPKTRVNKPYFFGPPAPAQQPCGTLNTNSLSLPLPGNASQPPPQQGPPSTQPSPARPHPPGTIPLKPLSLSNSSGPASSMAPLPLRPMTPHASPTQEWWAIRSSKRIRLPPMYLPSPTAIPPPPLTWPSSIMPCESQHAQPTWCRHCEPSLSSTAASLPKPATSPSATTTKSTYTTAARPRSASRKRPCS